MGGQACVLYGAAEFSRDTDLVILTEPENLAQIQAVESFYFHCLPSLFPFTFSFFPPSSSFPNIFN